MTARNRWGSLGPPPHNPAPNVAFVVHVGKRAIVGFREPPFKIPVGKGENTVGPNEVRVAPNCIAILDRPLTKDARYTFDRRDSAKFIASQIKGRVVAVRVEPKKGRRQ